MGLRSAGTGRSPDMPRPAWCGLGNVALFGDSRTAQWPLDVAWYPDGARIMNVGVSGNTVATFTHGAIAATPAHVWWHLGINDCIAGTAAATTLAGLKALVDTHQAEYPTSIVHVQTVVPVGSGHAQAAAVNAKVAEINAGIMSWGVAYGPVSVLAAMTDTAGGAPYLKASMTADNLHFNSAGYAALAVALGWRLA